MNLFAQILRPNMQTWGLGDFLIAIIVIAGAVAVTFIVLRVMGITVPEWLVKVFWIVLAVCVGVFAIRFIFGS